MKPTFLLISTLLLTILSCGCENETTKQKLTRIDKIYPIIDTIQTIDNSRAVNIRLYVIDSCEYVGHIYGYDRDFLVHKGNCKFCLERTKR
jgi:hypothetical protein